MVSPRVQALAHHTGVFRNSLTRYRVALERFPVSTKCITCAVGMAVGDILAQFISSKHPTKMKAPFKLDVTRTARIALFGGVVNGPLGHVWYTVLDRFVLPSNPTHPISIVVKCVLDQMIMAPIGTALFFSSMKCLEMKPMMCQEELKMKFIPSLLASYRLWPAAHLVNFAMIPSNFRILYINVVAVFWSAALSSMAEDRPST
eukprot:g8716.t1